MRPTSAHLEPMKNIFVIGLEPFNQALLEAIPNAKDYAFHRLLAYDEVVRPRSGHIDLPALLDSAQRRLEDFDGSIDGLLGYWDFPSSVIVPVLRRRLGLPSASLEAVAACEHKYWSRIEQRRVVPECIPDFRAVDPFVDDPLGQIDLPFPFWIKPVKAHSSYLGFKIRKEADFQECLPLIRDSIADFGEPFNAFLELVEVPAEVAGVGGNHCIAEEVISGGQQCTLEGYSFQGEVVVYGVVDSIRSGKHRSSMARYQYPSKLPRRVQSEMIEAASAFIRHIGYEGAPFNVEFYWSPERDEIRLLEVNSRLSKSHSPLFKMVDGMTHQKVGIDLTLGRRPNFPQRQGKHRLAGKFMLRVTDDAIVSHVPQAQDIERLKQRCPDAMVRVLAHEGQRLSHMLFQDSYSFEIAELFLGAHDQHALLEEYEAAQEMLPFRFEPPESTAK